MFHCDPGPVTVTVPVVPAALASRDEPVLVRVLPFCIVRTPCAGPPCPTCIAPTETLIGPVTPRTVGPWDGTPIVLMLTVAPAPGATPPVQLLPSVQSLLVVPVQFWAEAAPADRAISTTPHTVRRTRCRPINSRRFPVLLKAGVANEQTKLSAAKQIRERSFCFLVLRNTALARMMSPHKMLLKIEFKIGFIESATKPRLELTSVKEL